MKPKHLLLIKTVSICLGYVAVVSGCALLGPNLLEFKITANASSHQLADLLPVTYIGLGMGTLSAISLAVVPWLHKLWQLCLGLFAIGFSAGLVESAAIAHLLHLWGNESTGIMQVVDFLFGLGGMLGPLLAEPFLTENNISFNESGKITNSLTLDTIKVMYPYAIMSAISVVSLILLTLAYVIQKDDVPHPSRNIDEFAGSLPLRGRIKIILVSFLFLAFYSAMGTIKVNNIVIYGVNSDFRLTKQTGAIIAASTWAAYTFLGLAAIWVINRIGFRMNLIVAMVGLFFCNLLLLTLGNNYLWALCLSLIASSAFSSSVWGSLICHLEEQFPVGPKITAILLIAVTIGSIFGTYFVGESIESYPNSYIYSVGGCGLLVNLIFIVLLVTINRQKVYSQFS